MAAELNILVRIEIGKSLYLFGSPCLTVDKDELSLRGNYLVWMMIKLKDEISFNQFYLFLYLPDPLEVRIGLRLWIKCS